MKNERLERRLKTIQELKANKYIGTQEAWRYISSLDRLYSIPSELANSINLRVQKQTHLFYEATPARLIGLIKFFERNYDYFGVSDAKTLAFPPFFLSRIVFNHEDSNMKGAFVDSFFPSFIKAQYPGVTNFDFPLIYTEDLHETGVINEEQRDYFVQGITSIDWDIQMSDNFLRQKEEFDSSILYEYEICLRDRLIRMKKDGVDHRLENRREILTDYLNLVLRLVKDKDRNYNTVRLRAKNILDVGTRLKKLASEDNKSRDVLEETFEFGKFIFSLVSSERNFIERFLKN